MEALSSSTMIRNSKSAKICLQQLVAVDQSVGLGEAPEIPLAINAAELTEIDQAVAALSKCSDYSQQDYLMNASRTSPAKFQREWSDDL